MIKKSPSVREHQKCAPIPSMPRSLGVAVARRSDWKLRVQDAHRYVRASRR
jgi:hypothetical protein